MDEESIYKAGHIINFKARTIVIVRLIKFGGGSQIYQTEDISTNEVFALKIIIFHESALEENLNEIIHMDKVKNYSNTIKVLDNKLSKLKNQSKYYELKILMEYYSNGSIVDYINKFHQSKRLTEKQVLQIFSELVLSVFNLHSRNLIHRDLKLENFFLNEKGKLALGDLGSTIEKYKLKSNINKLKELKRSNQMEEFVQEWEKFEKDLEDKTTCFYRSPEIVKKDYLADTLDEGMDIWALGLGKRNYVYLIEFLIRCFIVTPFENSEFPVQDIINSKYVIPIYPSYSKSLIGLINLILNKDPKLRPDICTLLVTVYDLKHKTSTASDCFTILSPTSLNLNSKSQEKKGLSIANNWESIDFSSTTSNLKSHPDKTQQSASEINYANIKPEEESDPIDIHNNEADLIETIMGLKRQLVATHKKFSSVLRNFDIDKNTELYRELEEFGFSDLGKTEQPCVEQKVEVYYESSGSSDCVEFKTSGLLRQIEALTMPSNYGFGKLECNEMPYDKKKKDQKNFFSLQKLIKNSKINKRQQMTSLPTSASSINNSSDNLKNSELKLVTDSAFYSKLLISYNNLTSTAGSSPDFCEKSERKGSTSNFSKEKFPSMKCNLNNSKEISAENVDLNYFDFNGNYENFAQKKNVASFLISKEEEEILIKKNYSFSSLTKKFRKENYSSGEYCLNNSISAGECQTRDDLDVSYCCSNSNTQGSAMNKKLGTFKSSNSEYTWNVKLLNLNSGLEEKFPEPLNTYNIQIQIFDSNNEHCESCITNEYFNFGGSILLSFDPHNEVTVNLKYINEYFDKNNSRWLIPVQVKTSTQISLYITATESISFPFLFDIDDYIYNFGVNNFFVNNLKNSFVNFVTDLSVLEFSSIPDVSKLNCNWVFRKSSIWLCAIPAPGVWKIIFTMDEFENTFVFNLEELFNINQNKNCAKEDFTVYSAANIKDNLYAYTNLGIFQLEDKTSNLSQDAIDVIAISELDLSVYMKYSGNNLFFVELLEDNATTAGDFLHKLGYSSIKFIDSACTHSDNDTINIFVYVNDSNYMLIAFSISLKKWRLKFKFPTFLNFENILQKEVFLFNLTSSESNSNISAGSAKLKFLSGAFCVDFHRSFSMDLFVYGNFIFKSNDLGHTFTVLKYYGDENQILNFHTATKSSIFFLNSIGEVWYGETSLNDIRLIKKTDLDIIKNEAVFLPFLQNSNFNSNNIFQVKFQISNLINGNYSLTILKEKINLNEVFVLHNSLSREVCPYDTIKFTLPVNLIEYTRREYDAIRQSIDVNYFPERIYLDKGEIFTFTAIVFKNSQYQKNIKDIELVFENGMKNRLAVLIKKFIDKSTNAVTFQEMPVIMLEVNLGCKPFQSIEPAVSKGYCPESAESNIPCSYFSDVKDLISNKTKPFDANYFLNLIGFSKEKYVASDTINYFSKDEIQLVNPHRNQLRFQENVWIALEKGSTKQFEYNQLSNNYEAVFSKNNTVVEWACESNSICYGLVPNFQRSTPQLYLLFSMSNFNVDKTSYCKFETSFTVRLYGMNLEFLTNIIIVLVILLSGIILIIISVHFKLKIIHWRENLKYNLVYPEDSFNENSLKYEKGSQEKLVTNTEKFCSLEQLEDLAGSKFNLDDGQRKVEVIPLIKARRKTIIQLLEERNFSRFPDGNINEGDSVDENDGGDENQEKLKSLSLSKEEYGNEKREVGIDEEIFEESDDDSDDYEPPPELEMVRRKTQIYSRVKGGLFE
ncbi:hypothetical protein HK099_006917 [Clydaea vesicula]|uniref:non-specific serine/threonine protein kinase n=1 Tax=Clydaea vesicula TaxID=447962 RepID=A0AAD5U8T6_9FUNG|nr:hypothetical protein HK099_006917 [Clydaea vesicula]